MKWISIKDILPPDGVSVLMLLNGDKYIEENCIPLDDDIIVGTYDLGQDSFTTDYWGDYDFLSILEPTHWYPLPELCKEG